MYQATVGNNMETRERNKHIPLYYWIQCYDSINNLNEDLRAKHHIIGWHFLDEVLKKFVKIYKPLPKDFANVIYKAIDRYRTQYQHIPLEYRFFKDTKGKPISYPYDRIKRRMVVIKNKKYDYEEVRVQG